MGTALSSWGKSNISKSISAHSQKLLERCRVLTERAKIWKRDGHTSDDNSSHLLGLLPAWQCPEEATICLRSISLWYAANEGQAGFAVKFLIMTSTALHFLLIQPAGFSEVGAQKGRHRVQKVQSSGSYAKCSHPSYSGVYFRVLLSSLDKFLGLIFLARIFLVTL